MVAMTTEADGACGALPAATDGTGGASGSRRRAAWLATVVVAAFPLGCHGHIRKWSLPSFVTGSSKGRMESAVPSEDGESHRRHRHRHAKTLTDDLFADNNIIMLCDLEEEIEIDEFRGRDEQVEFVNQLLRCNVPLLERVVFNVPSCCLPESKEIIREKIHGKLRGDKIKV
uniref:Uncharacterized protein n=1 Tax=Oryza punctata TaxID=4537 RepID=A0A0E0LGY0_ORYPU